ncbi:unnamed protein product, partial [marine sediment metagenome]
AIYSNTLDCGRSRSFYKGAEKHVKMGTGPFFKKQDLTPFFKKICFVLSQYP